MTAIKLQTSGHSAPIQQSHSSGISGSDQQFADHDAQEQIIIQKEQEKSQNDQLDRKAKFDASFRSSNVGNFEAGKQDLNDVIKTSKTSNKPSLENKKAIEYMVLEFQRAGGSPEGADKLRSALSRVGTGTFNNSSNTNDGKIVNDAIMKIDTGNFSGDIEGY